MSLCAAAIACGDGASEPFIPAPPSMDTWDLTVDLRQHYAYPIFGGAPTITELPATLTGVVVTQLGDGVSGEVTCVAPCPYSLPTPLIYDVVIWPTSANRSLFLGQSAHSGYGIWFHMEPTQTFEKDSLKGDAMLTWYTGRSVPFHKGTFRLVKRR